MEKFIKERVGFEPTVYLLLIYKDLADLHFKPLSHLSKTLLNTINALKNN